MFRIRDPMLKMKMAGLTAGMVGIMVASYGNAVLGSMPTALCIYISMALMLNTEVLDTPPEKAEKEAGTDLLKIPQGMDYGILTKN
jgi:hypothetical protein